MKLPAGTSRYGRLAALLAVPLGLSLLVQPARTATAAGLAPQIQQIMDKPVYRRGQWGLLEVDEERHAGHAFQTTNDLRPIDQLPVGLAG